MEGASVIRLSIVFLNFNRLSETRQTVESLLQMSTAFDWIEIIAIDNGSEDGTAGYLQQQEAVTAICLPDNLGIAGYNVGFKQARGEYILVLDDDSCPESAQTLLRLTALLDENSSIGIVACSIRSVDGSPQDSWHLPVNGQFGPSPFFIGCGFVIRRELFARIGWYPENFFLYQNEIDVAFKSKLEHKEIFFDPESIVVHRGEPSQRPGWRRVFYPTRNTLWLIIKYYPQPFASYMIFSRLVIGLIRAVQFKEVAAYKRAVQEAFGEPVHKEILPAAIRKESSPFYRQNSIIHHIFKLT